MADRLGDYDLESLLGRGAMGTVYRARHRPTGAVRAVKVVAIVPDDELIARFRREAEALARAGGEGIVPVHEVGSERGRLYLVMSFMPGGSLRSKLAFGPLPWREAVPIAIDLCRALERCHAAGLIHRDLKPDNVLFDEQGHARLADFGLVRDLGAQGLTRTGSMIGTPAYMPPEQLAGRPVNETADIYALGSVLHELVAGRVPFLGADLPATVSLKARGKRARLEAAQAPRGLDAILDRALDPLPGKRYARAAELRADLERLLSGKPLVPGRSYLAWVGVALAFVVTAVALAAAFQLSRASVASVAPSAAPSPSPMPRRSPVPSSSPQPRGPSPEEAAKQFRRIADVLTGRAPIERVRATLERVLETTPLEDLPRDALDRIAGEVRRRTTNRPSQLDPKLLDAAYEDGFDALRLARRLRLDVEAGVGFSFGARDWARHFREGRDEDWSIAGVEAFLLAARRIDGHYAKDAGHGAAILRRRHPDLAIPLRALAAEVDALLREHHPDGALELRVEFLASDGRLDDALRDAIAGLRTKPSNDLAKDVANGLARAGWPPTVPCDPRLLDELFATVPGSPELLLLRLHRGAPDAGHDTAELAAAAANEGNDASSRTALFIELAAALERQGQDLECANSYEQRPGAVRELARNVADDARRHARVLLRFGRGREAGKVLSAAGGDLEPFAERARAAETPEACRALAIELR